jgi:hypothetical protein
LINHNLSGVEISAFFNFLGDFFEKISILEVEIGRNGLGILGVNPTLVREVISRDLRKPHLRRSNIPLAKIGQRILAI